MWGWMMAVVSPPPHLLLLLLPCRQRHHGWTLGSGWSSRGPWQQLQLLPLLVGQRWMASTPHPSPLPAQQCLWGRVWGQGAFLGAA